MKLAARAVVGIAAAALATTVAAAPAQAAPAPYDIWVVTCDVEDGGTDARVEARLRGDITSPWFVLDHMSEEFLPGATDDFHFVMPDLGPIRSVDIAIDPQGDHWCIEKVIVRGPDGVTVHPYNNWVFRPFRKVAPLRLGAV
ncbi:PLAT/LH2 domain-containing protein [Lentzea sp. NPDC051213]|uniref:PLAT/LH2 domain-containing protein n=1 Tax=Lentzea sp. NPDC051213 TaxID=3364126 RepID=UPI00379EEF0F